MGKLVSRIAVAVIAAGAAFAAPAGGQRTSLAMLDGLDSGRWELRVRGAAGQAEQICLNSGRRLIQLRHPDSVCDRVIVEDDLNEVTVQYTCRGRGYGRTHIRRETDRLVQIDSQGVAGGLPFAFSAEARRTGDCTG